MAITKEQKKKMIASYVDNLKGAVAAVAVQQKGLSVSVMTSMRKQLKNVNAKIQIVKKRLFALALKEAGYEQKDAKDLDGSIYIIYAQGDEFAPLKEMNTHVKKAKKDDKGVVIEFEGGWFAKEWKSKEYVAELAGLPSKDELLSKLLYLLKYPVQSFTGVVDQIAKKKEGE